MKKKLVAISACIILILVSIAFPVSGDPPFQPILPNPPSGSIEVPLDVDLSWTGGDPDGDPVTYDVYFGTTSPPVQVVGNQSGTTYDPGILDFSTTYYWRIIAWDNNSLFNASPIWNFTTIVNLPPYEPSNPNPSDGFTGVPLDTDLSWTGGDPDGDPTTYDVAFGSTNPPPWVVIEQSTTYYDPPGILNVNTTYYWRIIAWDNNLQFNSSPVWNFTTRANSPPYPASGPGPANNSIDVHLDVDLNWTGGDPDPYDTVTYNIYLGTDPDPGIIKMAHTTTTYNLPDRLNYNTQYFWRIETRDSYGEITDGPVWTFLTRDNNPPYIPSNPGPANESIDNNLFLFLNWTGGDPDPGDTLTYDVYFGTTNPPPMVSNNQSADTYDPGELNVSNTYYWKIRAWDYYAYSTTGPTWIFYTRDDTHPDIPSNPSPANNSVDVLIDVDLSWMGGDPDPGDTLTYNVFFGTDPDPPQVSSDQSTTNYDPGELDYDTQYYWRIEAQDNYGNSSNGPVWTFRTEIYINDPPNRPDAPDGPSFGKYLNSHTFTTSTTDPNGDQIFYRFDWDDGRNSGWIGPYESGRIAASSHAWLIQGSYAIRVQARDEHFALSEWSDPYSINMPKNKLLSRHPLFLLLFRFLEQHPHMSPILRLLLGL